MNSEFMTATEFSEAKALVDNLAQRINPSKSNGRVLEFCKALETALGPRFSAFLATTGKIRATLFDIVKASLGPNTPSSEIIKEVYGIKYSEYISKAMEVVFA